MARRSAILIGAAAVGVLAVAVAPGGVAADPHAQEAAEKVKQVSIGDNFFSPVKVRVRRLHKVRWTNNGLVEHTVTFKGGYSRSVGPGESVVKRFNKGGKHGQPIPYSCTIHPEMTGKVKVLPFG